MCSTVMVDSFIQELDDGYNRTHVWLGSDQDVLDNGNQEGKKISRMIIRASFWASDPNGHQYMIWCGWGSDSLRPMNHAGCKWWGI